MAGNATGAVAAPTQKKLFYGWVVVGIAAALLVMHAGLLSSFGVFFKPLAAEFGWSRAATSAVQSVTFIIMAPTAVTVGWLADRFGPGRILLAGGILTGLGLALSSRTQELWQLYLTYSLLTGIGISGNFTLASGTVVCWFVKRRGLALGIVASGVGLGTTVVVPLIARLIADFGWSRAYIVLGILAGVIMVTSSFFFRRPEQMGCRPLGAEDDPAVENTPRKEDTSESGITLRGALRTRPIWTMFAIFFAFAFCYHMILVHLVNYITDMGFDPITAATFISGIGIAGIAGRLLMGIAGDRIGNIRALIICGAGVAASLVWLNFASQAWMLYIFAAFYGFTYGGEVPQQAPLITRFYGMRAVTALVGVVAASALLGGALGAWTGGQIFDLTGSYRLAFIIAAAVVVAAVSITQILRNFYRAAGALPGRHHQY